MLDTHVGPVVYWRRRKTSFFLGERAARAGRGPFVLFLAVTRRLYSLRNLAKHFVVHTCELSYLVVVLGLEVISHDGSRNEPELLRKLAKCVGKGCMSDDDDDRQGHDAPVSYTHLTLPTSDLV